MKSAVKMLVLASTMLLGAFGVTSAAWAGGTPDNLTLTQTTVNDHDLHGTISMLSSSNGSIESLTLATTTGQIVALHAESGDNENDGNDNDHHHGTPPPTVAPPVVTAAWVYSVPGGASFYKLVAGVNVVGFVSIDGTGHLTSYKD